MNLPKLLLLISSLVIPVGAQTAATSNEVESVYPDSHALYLDLHQNPELSSHETQTATKLGVTAEVAVLRNLLQGSAEDLRRYSQH